MERIQTVVLMRHAVARHNVVDRATGKQPNLTSPSLLDSSLTTEGKVKAVTAGDLIQTWWNTTQAGKHIEMVVTSPLTRCIQTATIAFLPGDYAQPTAVIVCKEDVREAYGIHYPDRRREKSVLQVKHGVRSIPIISLLFVYNKNLTAVSRSKFFLRLVSRRSLNVASQKHWPSVQFEDCMTEEDVAWRADRRESWNELSRRVEQFVAWLVQQGGDNVVIVSHGVWIETLLRTYAPAALGRDQRVHNTDAFACHFISENGIFVRIQNVQQII